MKNTVRIPLPGKVICASAAVVAFASIYLSGCTPAVESSATETPAVTSTPTLEPSTPLQVAETPFDQEFRDQWSTNSEAQFGALNKEFPEVVAIGLTAKGSVKQLDAVGIDTEASEPSSNESAIEDFIRKNITKSEVSFVWTYNAVEAVEN